MIKGLLNLAKKRSFAYPLVPSYTRKVDTKASLNHLDPQQPLKFSRQRTCLFSRKFIGPRLCVHLARHYSQDLTQSRMSQTPEEHILWVDCEMTGLDVEKDCLLEVAVLLTDGQLNIIAEGPSLAIHQSDEVLRTMNPWCIEQHSISGLTEAVRNSKKSLLNCENEILDFVSRWVPKGKCPIAGNSVGEDRKFLVKYMPRLTDHLHYRIIDVSSIGELTKRWYPSVYKNRPKKEKSHRALDDIRESIRELQYYRDTIFK